MVYAVADVNKGEEITFDYIGAFSSYNERERHFQTIYNFKCECKLCEFERIDPRREERTALLKDLAKFSELFSSDTKKYIDEVTSIVKKVTHILPLIHNIIKYFI